MKASEFEAPENVADAPDPIIPIEKSFYLTSDKNITYKILLKNQNEYLKIQTKYKLIFPEKIYEKELTLNDLRKCGFFKICDNINDAIEELYYHISLGKYTLIEQTNELILTVGLPIKRFKEIVINIPQKPIDFHNVLNEIFVMIQSQSNEMNYLKNMINSQKNYIDFLEKKINILIEDRCFSKKTIDLINNIEFEYENNNNNNNFCILNENENEEKENIENENEINRKFEEERKNQEEKEKLKKKEKKKEFFDLVDFLNERNNEQEDNMILIKNNSNLLVSNEEDIKNIKNWLSQQYNDVQSNKINTYLLYSTAKDEKSNLIFHNKCDKQGMSIVYIMTDKNQKFGGFTSQNWESSEELLSKYDTKSFLFNLNTKTIFNNLASDRKIINCQKNIGPDFTEIKIPDIKLLKGFICCNDIFFNKDNKIIRENEFNIKLLEVYKVVIN